MKRFVIVNPNAGGGKCKRDWQAIKKILDGTGLIYDYQLTIRPFHAMVITRAKIREGYREIIIVGGDGTLNEVINGIFAQKELDPLEMTIGMIPVGTGNDWCRMFGIPLEYNKAITTLLKRNTFVQDVGKVYFRKKQHPCKRYFINIAGIGFDAVVAKRGNELKEQGKSSMLLYFMNIFAGLFGYRHFQATLNIDGNEFTHDIFSMSIGICKFNGGGMIQLPDAIPDDGQFDLIIIQEMSKFRVLRSLPMLYNGRIKKHKRVITMTAKNIKIESGGHIALETDGESLGNNPMEFEIIPRAVRVIMGA